MTIIVYGCIAISMANSDEILTRIEQRLDLIAHLLVLAIPLDKRSPITDQIALLREHGLSAADIGRVIGRKANYVSAVVTAKKAK